jgi:hypothetical protein
MNARYMLVLALSATAAGCERAKPVKTAELADALPDLYLPSNFSFVSRSGSEDALQITVRTPLKQEEVAEYYRNLLTRDPWTMESDMKDREGALMLHATRNAKPPIWVRIAPDTAYNATLVQVSGAVVNEIKLDGVAGQQIPTAGSQPRQ